MPHAQAEHADIHLHVKRESEAWTRMCMQGHGGGRDAKAVHALSRVRGGHVPRLHVQTRTVMKGSEREA